MHTTLQWAKDHGLVSSELPTAAAATYKFLLGGLQGRGAGEGEKPVEDAGEGSKIVGRGDTQANRRDSGPGE